MILPDIVINPTNLKHVSVKSDSTPTFTWDPSRYNKNIKGYYVKIDNSPEIFIGNTTIWTSSDIVSDGAHRFYVRAEAIDNKSSNTSSIIFSIDSLFIDTDNDGWSDQEEQLYGSDPNNPINYPLDTDGDHIPNSDDKDDDNDGYSDDMEGSYKTDSLNINDFPTDSDSDGIPDDSSLDKKYPGDEDDDNDGLKDSVETLIGSNPKDSSDTTILYIIGKQYYLVDLSQNGFYDILYEPTSGTKTGVEKHNEDYLIDVNRDGSWDYIYRYNDGSISAYKDESELTIPIWLIIIPILLPIIFFYYLRKKAIKYQILKEQEKIIKKPLEREPLKIPVREKRETVDMISETKELLQYIQRDVEVYMEKLREIEEQFIETEEISEEERIITEEEEEPEITDESQKTEIKIDKILESKKEEIKETEKIPEEVSVVTEEEKEPSMLGELQKTEITLDKIFDLKKEKIPEEESVVTEEEEEPEIIDESQEIEKKVDKILESKKEKFKEKVKNKHPEVVELNATEKIKWKSK